MIRVVAVGLALTAIAIGAQVSAQSEPRLSICHSPPEEQPTEWQRSSLRHILRILSAGNALTEVRVRRAVCNETMPDSACAGLPNELFCRQASFDRMQVAAAWYTIAYLQSEQRSYEAFRKAHPETVGKAFRFADGALNADDVAAEVAELRRQTEARAERPDSNEAPSRLAAIHERIVAYNVAALVGHESHHMGAEVCPIGDKSRMELNGIFDHIVAAQTSGDLFKASFPDPNEIKADRCAMRQIGRLNRMPIGDPSDPFSDESFARRAAADMITFQALVGFRRFEQLPRGVYVTPEFDQYLHPAFRIVLLAGSVADAGARPAICGEAAELFVRAVQDGFGKEPGGGEVSDELLAELPSGVETSWNGAPWTADSVSCVQN